MSRVRLSFASLLFVIPSVSSAASPAVIEPSPPAPLAQVSPCAQALTMYSEVTTGPQRTWTVKRAEMGYQISVDNGGHQLALRSRNFVHHLDALVAAARAETRLLLHIPPGWVLLRDSAHKTVASLSPAGGGTSYVIDLPNVPVTELLRREIRALALEMDVRTHDGRTQLITTDRMLAEDTFARAVAALAMVNGQSGTRLP